MRNYSSGEYTPLPDMILSYHGANGFEMVHSATPLLKMDIPPAYQPRPLKLLADAEYRLRITTVRLSFVRLRF